MSEPDLSTRLLGLAREIAVSTPGFSDAVGPGAGNRVTDGFMRELRRRAKEAFGKDCSEQKICGPNSLAVDFYFPDEATIVEVGLGLPKPNTEFEKDILKAIMAQELGHPVRRLILISKAGGEKKCRQPGRTAMKNWALTNHKLTVEVHDLPGEPYKRRRMKS